MPRLSSSRLPTPVVPGGYDYGRSLWFEGIGATGRLYGDIVVDGTDSSWLLAFPGWP